MGKKLGKDFLFSDDLDYSKLEDGYGTKYSDGSGYFEGDDGTKIYRYSDGSGYYENADGSRGYKYSDGSGYFEEADGSKGHRYSDGSGYFENENGYTNYWDKDDVQEGRGKSSAEKLGENVGNFIYDVLSGAGNSIRNLSEEENNKRSKARTKIKKKKNEKIILGVCFGSLFLIIGISLLIAFLCNIPKKGEIKIDFSAKECIGQNYRDIEKKFLDRGFTNIETVPKNDLITGWINKENHVDKVTIGGERFSKNNIVSKDAKVVITYHSFKKKK